MNSGHRRELQVREQLEHGGWVVIRAAGSLGPVDLVALKRGERTRLVQVKTDRAGPFTHFGPSDRVMLRDLAGRAGGDPWLVWWPVRRPCAWIAESAWPTRRELAR